MRSDAIPPGHGPTERPPASLAGASSRHCAARQGPRQRGAAHRVRPAGRHGRTRYVGGTWHSPAGLAHRARAGRRAPTSLWRAAPSL